MNTLQISRKAKKILRILFLPVRFCLQLIVNYLEKHPKLRYKVVISTYHIVPWLYDYIHKEMYAGFSMLSAENKTVLSGKVTTTFVDPYSRHEADEVIPNLRPDRTIYLYVDHTISCSTNTGVQRVTRGMARGLIQAEENVLFVKWDNFNSQCVLINQDELERLCSWNGPEMTPTLAEKYRSTDIKYIPVGLHVPGEGHWLIVPEVTHINDYRTSLMADIAMWSRVAGLKLGAVFYDSIPLKRPEFIEMAEPHQDYMRGLLLADIVWPISDWSRNDLLAYWQKYEQADTSTIPETNTVHLPGEIILADRVDQVQPGEKLVLSVGTIEPRKNQLMLLQVFNKFKNENTENDWKLVLVGNIHSEVYDKVQEEISKCKDIEYHRFVSDQMLADYYQRAAFTVFPSIEEGFGLPILESLWYATPCLCAGFGSMGEVAKDGGCLTADMTSFDDVYEALADMIVDGKLRDRLASEAVTRRIPCWRDYAESICTHLDNNILQIEKLKYIYYRVDATLCSNSNSGIQRVVRQLARGLLENGYALIPVKWDNRKQKLCYPDEDELQHLENWNGPGVQDWHEWIEPVEGEHAIWLFMPELPLSEEIKQNQSVTKCIKKLGIKTAAIFFDAIPWKLREIYPQRFSESHYKYMIELYEYDLVLPISKQSRCDLVNFLGSELPRPQSLEGKIKCIPLAGEFPENRRTTTMKPESSIEEITMVCVGTVEPRKNHLLLIEAFKLAVTRTRISLKLVILGGKHDALALRVGNIIDADENITWESDVSDGRLHEVFENCDFSIFPSYEEGFGLPVLESIWYAKPCICSRSGAMAESASGGGCFTVDVTNVEELASAITKLSEDKALRDKLANEAINREIKTWREYSRQVASQLAEITKTSLQNSSIQEIEIKKHNAAMPMETQPVLSLCISTYNRAAWLKVNLENILRLYPEMVEGVEIVICDNASTDHTQDIVTPFLSTPGISYHRNTVNVGMLGNLHKTAIKARGKYIWIIGDDDLIVPGSIEKILSMINDNPQVALIYLNYAYTRIQDTKTIKDFDKFFREAVPIVPPEKDLIDKLNKICARNENFFTAIYTLVFRRDHAIRAYSQNTSGRPFSTLLTCIPTTNYILDNLMDKMSVWVGTPLVVVNMNVSWLKYASLWILERIPEVYEKMEQRGVSHKDIDKWRLHTLPGISKYYYEIFSNDPGKNAEYFSVPRLVRRYKHLSEFKKLEPALRSVYELAHNNNHIAARLNIAEAFHDSVS